MVCQIWGRHASSNPTSHTIRIHFIPPHTGWIPTGLKLTSTNCVTQWNSSCHYHDGLSTVPLVTKKHLSNPALLSRILPRKNSFRYLHYFKYLVTYSVLNFSCSWIPLLWWMYCTCSYLWHEVRWFPNFLKKLLEKWRPADPREFLGSRIKTCRWSPANCHTSLSDVEPNPPGWK